MRAFTFALVLGIGVRVCLFCVCTIRLYVACQRGCFAKEIAKGGHRLTNYFVLSLHHVITLCNTRTYPSTQNTHRIPNSSFFDFPFFFSFVFNLTLEGPESVASSRRRMQRLRHLEPICRKCVPQHLHRESGAHSWHTGDDTTNCQQWLYMFAAWLMRKAEHMSYKTSSTCRWPHNLRAYIYLANRWGWQNNIADDVAKCYVFLSLPPSNKKLLVTPLFWHGIYNEQTKIVIHY